MQGNIDLGQIAAENDGFTTGFYIAENQRGTVLIRVNRRFKYGAHQIVSRTRVRDLTEEGRDLFQLRLSALTVRLIPSNFMEDSTVQI